MSGAADMLDAALRPGVARQVFDAAVRFVDADEELLATDDSWDANDIAGSGQRARAAGYAWKEAKRELKRAVSEARK